ncbi:hypothetical protein BJ322DRAFT_87431 [Thelephora terrestris]|uniref:Uncharacterized protein n=1 Tax=Thelephora terrestris TaxID=56493 RepID=A0A9P6LD74_9AGAM|nr:hypothetical protein BJ322DRAFT_87431 [Thelephora terrestris]
MAYHQETLCYVTDPNVHICCERGNCGVLVPFAVNGTYNGDGKKIIRFNLDNSRTCGIPFSRVLRGDLEGLVERDELAKLNPPANSMRLKLDLSGYILVDKKMNTPTATFTVEKLVRNVCRQVAAFVNAAEVNVGAQPEWIIGQRGIVVEQLVLVSIKRISAGYWVPCIRLVNGQE